MIWMTVVDDSCNDSLVGKLDRIAQSFSMMMIKLFAVRKRQIQDLQEPQVSESDRRLWQVVKLTILEFFPHTFEGEDGSGKVRDCLA